MDLQRKRRIRLVSLLSAAVLLAGALVYTTFAGASPAQTPGQLLTDARPGSSYQLTGTVMEGSLRRRRGTLAFRVRDRKGAASVPVRYTGAVPEPFREGREIIVTVRRQGAAFVGERDSLITKCPSKFSAAKRGS
ncbi:MAG: cytochrome c-type biosis protein CcmE [Thermoleophilaceae bacterium]|nr:cytochrome c-type biosis protein CcmE [Thermoleophilaceae bacterium]